MTDVKQPLTTRSASAANTGTLIPAIDTSGPFLKLTIQQIMAALGVVVVAASNSRNVGFAAYNCDGTADNVEIQAAIDSLAAVPQGRVLLLAGSYSISAPIEINKDGIVLEGEGHGGQSVDGTTLRPIQTFANNSFVIKVHRVAEDRPLAGVQLRNFAIRAGTLNNLVTGIDLCCNRATLENVWAQSMTLDGMQVRQISGDTNREMMLTRCHFARNSRYGMYALGFTDGEVVQCEFHNNGVSNFYGNISSVQFFGGQFYAGNENPAAAQTVKNVHLALGANRARFIGVRFEHGLQELVHMDGTSFGGDVGFVGCITRNGGGQTANTYAQIRVSGTNTWNLEIDGHRCYADVTTPIRNLTIATGALRFGRIGSGVRWADFGTEAHTALTTGTSGVGYKTTFGLRIGKNNGNPNSAGDWLNIGEFGVVVYDTVGGGLWLCVVPGTGGTWIQIG